MFTALFPGTVSFQVLSVSPVVGVNGPQVTARAEFATYQEAAQFCQDQKITQPIIRACAVVVSCLQMVAPNGGEQHKAN